MEKKKRIITAIVMFAVYLLIHFLFIKDGTLTVMGLIAIAICTLLNMKFMGWFAVFGYPLGYLIGVWCDTPSDIGTLPNNLYVIWMFVLLGAIIAGACIDVYLKVKGGLSNEKEF